MISIVWVMSFGTSFRQYTKLDGMCYILIKNLICSGLKFLQNLFQEFPWQTAITRRRFQNQSQSPSIKLRPFPLYWPNPRRRSTSSPNTSNPWKPLSKTMLKSLTSTQEYLMPRLPNLQSTRMRFENQRNVPLPKYPKNWAGQQHCQWSKQAETSYQDDN